MKEITDIIKSLSILKYKGFGKIEKENLTKEGNKKRQQGWQIRWKR